MSFLRKISGNESLDYPELFETVGKLAAFPDSKFQTKQKVMDLSLRKKYGVNGAYEEAVLGYPNLAHALTSYESFSTDSKEQKQLHMLLVLMSTIEDTCVLHRSDETTLFKMQNWLMMLVNVCYRILVFLNFFVLPKETNFTWRQCRSAGSWYILVEVKSWEKKAKETIVFSFNISKTYKHPVCYKNNPKS